MHWGWYLPYDSLQNNKAIHAAGTFMLTLLATKRTLDSQNRAGKYRCKSRSSLYENEWQHVRLQHLQHEYLREILRSSAVPSDKRWMKNVWHSQSTNWQRHASIQDFGAQQSRILRASWKTFSAWKTRTQYFDLTYVTSASIAFSGN